MSMLNWYPSEALSAPRERTIAANLQEREADYTVKLAGSLLPANIDAAHARAEVIGDALYVRIPKSAASRPGKKVA